MSQYTVGQTLKLISWRLPLPHYKIKTKLGSVPLAANAVSCPAAPACCTGQSCRVDKVAGPLAKKLHQIPRKCSLRQKCALICLSGLLPLHSKNCYARICSMSNNQAGVNLECCWTRKLVKLTYLI